MPKTDLEIANAAQLLPINHIASKLGVPEEELIPFGKFMAKLPLKLINTDRIKDKKLVLVTAITPTQAGEGKTTVSIGLSEGLNKIGHKSVVVLREPSLGPVFGLKGGAAGGGYAQVLPMEAINLHFTGDFSAVEKAHNLLSALLDNHIHNQGNKLNIDPRKIIWKRVMDMNERSLRDIVIGLGGTAQGIPRESGFDITAASEVMAALCLANDLRDLKEKLGNIIVAYTFDNKPVFAHQLRAQGAMAALMKQAIMPNLVQTLEGNPAILHGGPFANIAQGSNSIIATKMGLTFGDIVVTEAGFASDLGGEKFCNLKCQYAGLKPDAAVIVTTVRALKSHAGIPLKFLGEPDPEALAKGLPNLEKHIENMLHFRLVPVVAINRFASDSEAEIQLIIDRCRELGVHASVCDAWASGGEGCRELASMVSEVIFSGKSQFTPLYQFDWGIEEKIATIAAKIYGASGVEYSVKAKQQIALFNKIGLDKLPVCIAKTQYSLSDNPKLLNRPEGFVLTIREFDIAAGAGFIVPIAGTIMRMPGLPEHPAAEQIDIDAEGNITGLF
jgi:formate--tetrahydrofolate ligase